MSSAAKRKDAGETPATPSGFNDERTTTSPPVGLLKRLAVMVYDGLLLFAVLFAATFVLLPFTGGEAIAPNNLLYTIYILAVSFAYLGWFWTHGGQTLGMRAWGVRLIGEPQTAITWRRCLARLAGALLSWIPCGLGFLWAAFDRDKLAWHDRLSRTRLVNERHPAN